MTNHRKTFTLTLIAVALLTAFAYGAGFKHDLHEKSTGQCAVCHPKEAIDISPDKGICGNCHDIAWASSYEPGKLETHGAYWFREHKSYARAGEGMDHRSKCSSCHDQAYCRDCHRESFREDADPAKVHRSDYLVTHPIMARRDPKRCVSCHEEQLCIDCHNRFRKSDLRYESHHKSWSSLQPSGLSPAHANFTPDQCGICHSGGVLPAHEWSNRHASEARRNIQLCQTCHEDGDVCMRCHSSKTGLKVSPHPKNWGKISGKYEKATNGKTCRKCH